MKKYIEGISYKSLEKPNLYKIDWFKHYFKQYVSEIYSPIEANKIIIKFSCSNDTKALQRNLRWKWKTENFNYWWVCIVRMENMKSYFFLSVFFSFIRWIGSIRNWMCQTITKQIWWRLCHTIWYYKTKSQFNTRWTIHICWYTGF